MPIASSVFPALSCTSFKVSCLILRSTIYFEIILVQGDRHESSFSFLQADNYFSQQHFLKRLSFLHMFLASLSKIRWESLCGFIYGSSILFHSFCASVMLFLLVWLCCTDWGQVLWYLQCCFFCSVLSWLFMVFCVSK
jgi:hypothetical protein